MNDIKNFRFPVVLFVFKSLNFQKTDLKTRIMSTKKSKNTEKKSEEQFPGYPVYPPNEDIYKTDKEEKDLDPEDITKKKSTNQSSIDKNLDVPGSELDDDQEDIGNEDEENNYYSLGGDEHTDLEEDKS